MLPGRRAVLAAVVACSSCSAGSLDLVVEDAINLVGNTGCG
jgi:hypothetical protein